MIDAKKTWKVIAKYKTFGEADTARKTFLEEYEMVKVQKYADHYGIKVWNPSPQKKVEKNKVKTKKGDNSIRRMKNEKSKKSKSKGA